MIHAVGDMVLMDEGFKLSKINTWLNPFVKIFINLWNRGQYINYSHCGIIAMHEGQLYFWESVKDGFLPTKPAYERFIGIENKVLTLRAKDYLSQRELDKINAYCAEIYGRDYDYEGIFHQAIYTISNSLLWIDFNKKNDTKKFYCVRSIAYIYNKLNSKYFPDWMKLTQKGLYLSNHFTHIKHT